MGLKCLKSGFSCLDQAPQLDGNTERALRQCIRQLELLRTVWVDVLPMNVYCKTLGKSGSLRFFF